MPTYVAYVRARQIVFHSRQAPQIFALSQIFGTMGRHDSQPVSSASGLYVTLKVFQLVNQLKKRLRTRRQSTAAHAAETNKQAAKQRFERDAFHGIESCLSSHISGLDGRKSRARTEGVRKIRKQQCPKSLLESRRDDGRARNSFDR